MGRGENAGTQEIGVWVHPKCVADSHNELTWGLLCLVPICLTGQRCSRGVGVEAGCEEWPVVIFLPVIPC
jgi:hypothetical protein